MAAPYDLGDFMCREIAASSGLSGYIANSAPDPKDRNPLVAGWWVDRSEGLWFIRPSAASSTVVLLGARTHQGISADLLLEARRKSVRRLLLVDVDGLILREIDLSGSYANPILLDQTSRRFGDLCYENVFDEIFGRIGDKLKLPVESFESNRVLLLIGSLGPGGSERQAAYTAAGLARTHTYEVYIGCNHIERYPDNLFKPMVEAAGVKVRSVANRPPEFDAHAMVLARQRLTPYNSISAQNIFHAILQYASMIRAVRPAIVHTWTDYCNVFAGIAAELVGVPQLVLGGRSLAPDNYVHLFHPYMRPGYLSIFRQRNARFVNNSRAGAVDYARWLDLPSDQFEIIYNGFEFPAEISGSARDAVRSTYGIPHNSLVVGSITRFSEEKRPELFIDMAKIIHTRNPQVCFLVFGVGPMLERIRSYVEKCELSSVVQLPGVTADAWQALAAMDVFVLSSRIEGLPNVLIEAQASGLPVVCTGVGGMDETFINGETGYSVRAATADALADAVMRLIDEPQLRAQMSERAIHQARDTFGIAMMLAQTAKAYCSGSACVT